MKKVICVFTILILSVFASQASIAQFGFTELPKDQFVAFQNIDLVSVNCIEDPNCPGFEVVWLTGLAVFDAGANNVVVGNFTFIPEHPTAVIELLMECGSSTHQRIYRREMAAGAVMIANCNGFIPTPPNPATLKRVWAQIVLPD